MKRLTILAALAISACAPSEAITRAPGETRTAITAGADSSVGPVTRPPRRQCLGAFTNEDPGELGKEKLK